MTLRDGVALACLVGAAALGGRLGELRRGARTGAEAPAKEHALVRLGVTALGGLRAFVLDALWCQAVGQWMRKEWDASEATFDLIEALEPRVPEVYVVAAWTSCFQIAPEAERRGHFEAAFGWMQAGLARLERGRLRNPKSARLPYVASFVLYQQCVREPYASRLRAQGIEPLQRARELAVEASRLAPRNHAVRFWELQAHRAEASWLAEEGRRSAARAALERAEEARRACLAALPPVLGEADAPLRLFRERVEGIGEILRRARAELAALSEGGDRAEGGAPCAEGSEPGGEGRAPGAARAGGEEEQR
ncbi:MAG: hypothetical protein D6731_16705 [Planctomycetota bacterium]|nr:MAG: hypothetical protein D6731_16705 [Planctomycetota bacterium]